MKCELILRKTGRDIMVERKTKLEKRTKRERERAKENKQEEQVINFKAGYKIFLVGNRRIVYN